jgi:tetratricopeptide (TPR) repeat protein
MRKALLVGLLSLTASCLYFNAVYDANQAYDEALRLQQDGEDAMARVRFDTVIAITGRIVTDHSDTKYAAPAAVLKARSELALQRSESAAASASQARALTTVPRLSSTAMGLEGVAKRLLGDLPGADSALTMALSGDIDESDRALFLFHRGMARLESGDRDLAAADLAESGVKAAEASTGQLDLAEALSEVGQYESSTALTVELMRVNRFANYRPGMLQHLDSLARRAPLLLDSALALELDEPGLAETKLAALYYYRGRSLEHAGRPGAVAMYDSARAASAQSRYATAASYRAGRLRIFQAREPSDIVATRSIMQQAANTLDRAIAVDARRLNERVILFSNLVDAYESRGATAAEAALRAAEIAGVDLAAPSVRVSVDGQGHLRGASLFGHAGRCLGRRPRAGDGCGPTTHAIGASVERPLSHQHRGPRARRRGGLRVCPG